MKKISDNVQHIKAVTLKISHFHFILSALYVLQTIIFHASKLITPELLLKRWIAVALLALVTTLVWFVGRTKQTISTSYRIAIWGMILADLAFASFNVYTQRGYASKAVVLFMLPIIVSALLRSRTSLIVTALLAIIAYSTTSIAYFVLNFNEGYMAELYSEIAFYSGIFLLITSLLWLAIPKIDKK